MQTLQPFTAADERPHTPVGASDAPWVDTWWIVCHDPERDVLVETHLTLLAVQGVARSSFLVRAGGRSAQSVWLGPSAIDTAGHGSGEVHVEVVNGDWTADKRLRLRIDGKDGGCDLLLAGRFDAADATLLAPGFMPVDAASGAVMRNAQHGMTFFGTVTVEGERIEVSGQAFRDRSWGWRQNNELFRHGWLAVLGHTADAVFSVTSFFGNDARSGENGRATAWLADADGVRATTETAIELDGAGIPTAVSLSTPARRLTLTRAEHLGATFLPMHEAHGDGNERLIGMMNHHLVLTDADGNRSWGYANVGWPLMTRPLEGMRMFPES